MTANGEPLLRPMGMDDLEATHRLVRQVSWAHRAADCELLLGLGSGIAACDADGQVIGIGMWWGFGQDAATIGMVLVSPEHQRKGIGRALMSKLIADAEPRALMLNATADGRPLYETLGFVQVGGISQHQAPLAEPAKAPEVPAVPVRPAATSDRDALVALDAAAFGADRSALIDRLLAAGQAWVAGDAAQPTGFTILRAFGRGQMIGPVIAADEDEAIALVAAAVRAATPGVLRVDIPAPAARLASWLTESGLPAVSAATTMRRGAWPAASAGPQCFGLAAQALG